MHCPSHHRRHRSRGHQEFRDLLARSQGEGQLAQPLFASCACPGRSRSARRLALLRPRDDRPRRPFPPDRILRVDPRERVHACPGQGRHGPHRPLPPPRLRPTPNGRAPGRSGHRESLRRTLPGQFRTRRCARLRSASRWHVESPARGRLRRSSSCRHARQHRSACQALPAKSQPLSLSRT